MLSAPKSRMVLTCLAVIAGGAILFADLRRAPPPEAGSSLAPAQVVLPPESDGLAARPRSGRSAVTEPLFDIVRIEPGGEAIIAGRAAPGASIELLRDGDIHDKAITDASGQFVMVPPRLPPGKHELTLVSRQPDGKQTTSKSVTVAIGP
jgi:hypothetical protein